MIDKRAYEPIEENPKQGLMVLGGFAALMLIGLAAAWYMEHNGHWVTGMNNQNVWGLPHVFAIFLIVAASGALNVASIASVFGKTAYKPLARLSAVLSVALLAGGLVMLVLDLGRPDRLIVAMTTYNFKSIFAWNINLYVGLFGIVGLYLWVMIERRMHKYVAAVGTVALVWRLVLTTCTGSIFGFLVSRQAYDAAILAPTFIVLSLVYGLAIFLIVLWAACLLSDRPLGDDLVKRLRDLLRLFILIAVYFIGVYHVTNLYVAENNGVESFILATGGGYTAIFWIGQVLIGYLIPLALLFHPGTRESLANVLWACAMVVVGGLAQMYVTVIAGLAYPIEMFPGYDVKSSFFDGVVAQYSPSFAEFALGLGGIALAMFLVTFALKVLPLLPVDLSKEG